MYESIKQILIRRDSLSISDVDSLINQTRDNLASHTYKNDLNWSENVSEDFFNLELDQLDKLID